MAGSAWSNSPGGALPAVAGLVPPPVPGMVRAGPVKVRELQGRLWAAARQFPGRRFHALYDRVHRGEVLWEAWCRVRENRGAAGVDRVTLAFVQDEYGVERMLAELQADLRGGMYRPAPARRVDIPKPDGSKRPLGIPAVRDRVAQQAAKIVLEPVFEADFLDFLGCHFRARMSGRLWEQKRIVGYYLHRWPSQQAMKRLREKVRARAGSNRGGADIREVIAGLNPLLRGWGNYFRTGNAADKFIQVDRYVAWRLKRLLVKKRGRNLRAGQASQWTREWMHGMGLYKLSGTIRYPKAA
jgi:Group II intron, maturase-specific domain